MHLTESGKDSLHTDAFLNDNLTVYTNSGSAILNASYTFIDVKIRINSFETQSFRTMTTQIFYNPNGTVSFTIPRPDWFDSLDADIYIFIVEP